MLDWVATALTLTGFTLITYKKRLGFLVQMNASFFWIAFGYMVHSSAVIFINIFMFFISLKGWFKWKRNVCVRDVVETNSSWHKNQK